MVVELDRESYELLRPIRRSAGVAEATGPVLQADDGDRGCGTGGDDGEAQGIPPGHRPLPGSWRVWHPDRSPGQKPAPPPATSRCPPGRSSCVAEQALNRADPWRASQAA
jgi:hypothetical protein